MKLKKRNKKRITIIMLVILILLAVVSERAYMTYTNNTKMIWDAIDGVYSDGVGIKEMVATLEKHKDVKWARKSARIELYSNMALGYSLEHKYNKMVQCATQAIYLADSARLYNYSAWNYINLANVFNLISDYKTAEHMIEKALEYKIENEKKDNWVKETAYLTLSDTKSKEGNLELAEKYLELSSKYSAEDNYDHNEMEYSRKAIMARIYCEKGMYDEASKLIKEIEAIKIDHTVLEIGMLLELNTCKAEIEIVRSNVEEGKIISDRVLALCEKEGFIENKIRFLKKIVPLYEEKAPEIAEEYGDEMIRTYDELVSISNDLSTRYIVNLYTNIYEEQEKNYQKMLIILVCTSITIFVIMLFIMLIRSSILNNTDALTGIYNRRYFDKIYSGLMKKKKTFALIMLDIDFFKNINDTYGHGSGDIILINLANQLSDLGLKDTTLFRIGGEEFAIIYKCSKAKEAVDYAEMLRQEVEKGKGQGDVPITISGGVAFTGQSYDLYRLADKYLYDSKNNGRNRISYLEEGAEIPQMEDCGCKIIK